MILVENIAVEFSGTTLFKDVNFVINPDDKIALMGKNGAGKSTMMKIIAGVDKPTRGNVQTPKEAVIAYLPQHLLTEDDCSVFEVFKFPNSQFPNCQVPIFNCLSFNFQLFKFQFSPFQNFELNQIQISKSLTHLLSNILNILDCQISKHPKCFHNYSHIF